MDERKSGNRLRSALLGKGRSKDEPIEHGEAVRQQPKYRLKPISRKKTDLGVKATVVCYVGQNSFKDEVQLSNATRRARFIQACKENLSLDLTSKEEKEFDRRLANMEVTIRIADAKMKNSTDSEQAKPVMTEEEKSEALALLQDPALLFNVGSIFHSMGLAGETTNALVLYLVITSRLLPKIVSVAIKAESGAGKSFLDDLVRKLFPPEAYFFMSGMSRQALIYLDEDFRHRMIIIAEASGIANASYNLRTLLSENKLRYTVTEKDPESGQHKTRIVDREGPTGLITTTTWSQLHPENETRLISLSLDESEQQTQGVKKSIADPYEEVDKEEPNLDAWINAQRLLRHVKVKIPYAKFLADKTPNRPLRMRRDFGKLLSIIEASAVFHQFQRKQIKEGIIEANLEDYLIAKTLLEDVFFASLYGIHPNTRALMEAIKELCQSNNLKQLTTRQLMDHLGWSKSKVTRWGKPLKDYEWIEVADWPDKGYRYQPGIDPRESNAKLPSVEELAAHFPELAEGFEAIHPLTGETLKLCNDAPAQDSNQSMGEGVSGRCKSE